MHPLSRLLVACAVMLAAESRGNPAEARRIQTSWQLAMENWSLATRAATTPEERDAAIAKQPDTLPYARDMWRQIGPNLDQEWTLEPAAWFLRVAPGLKTPQPDGSAGPAFTAEIDAILSAIESHHLQNPDMVSTCMALAGLRGPRALALLEKIQTTHPDPGIQGVAALAAALIFKSLGDDPELTRKRLTCLRKAIIQSSDVDLGGVTVAKLAEDELHIIRYLGKGRVAPDLSGTDSAGQPVKLSDFQGRVIILLFWHSAMPEAGRVIGITAEMAARFDGKPLTVLGVNQDPLAQLRAMEADDRVTWRNFSDPSSQLAREYRVTSWPMAYVLDGQRQIHYAGPPGSFAELTAAALLAETKPPSGR
jgi:peroxiredoxin